MSATFWTVVLDEGLADQARRHGVDISAAARDGVIDAVRAAMGQADRAAYERMPETATADWTDVERWGED